MLHFFIFWELILVTFNDISSILLLLIIFDSFRTDWEGRCLIDFTDGVDITHCLQLSLFFLEFFLKLLNMLLFWKFHKSPQLATFSLQIYDLIL